MKLSTRRTIYGYLFLLPWAVGFLAFLSVPLARSFWLSFNKLDSMVGFKFSFHGLNNYRDALLVSPEVLPLLASAFARNVIDVPIILVFSLVVALIINQELIGRGFFRAVFFLPVVVVSGAVISYLYDQNMGTLTILREIDLDAALVRYMGPVLAEHITDLVNRISLVLWRSGVQIIIFLAGLQGISSSLYEAARVDGCSNWEMFWRVTLPMLAPVAFVNVVYTIVDSFTDPMNEFIDFMYRAMFSGGGTRMGFGSAVGWLYLILVFAVILGVFSVFSRYTHSGEM